jgi:hypothetical protein
MTSLNVRAVALLVLIFAAGCHSGIPTSPSPSPALVARAEPFEVTGVVSDDAGRPLPGIAVTMRHWFGGFIQSPAALTDATGAYKIAFAANPWNEGSSGKAAARAELIAYGYEWYYRTIFATGPHLLQSFRLHPLQRIAPGESVVLPLAPDDGLCVTELSWTLATACRTLRVTAQANGSMTVQAISQGNAGQPLVSVCCVSGNDRGGNPVTLPVTAGTEFTVEVGLFGGFTTTQSIVVRTSFDP